MGQFLSSCKPSRLGPHVKNEGDITDSTSELGRSHNSADALPVLRKAEGHYWYPLNGPKILDACGGAGVACLGHGRKDIIKAVTKQMNSYTYASYAHFRVSPVEELSDWLVKSTGGKMQKVYVMCSGKANPQISLTSSHPPFSAVTNFPRLAQAPKQWKRP